MKILLAGAESDEPMVALKKSKHKNILMSYYYLRKRDKAIDNASDFFIFVDSGAHTFFSEQTEGSLAVTYHVKKTKTKDTPEEYMQAYIKWIKERYKDINYFVELDIGEIVGQEKILEWRKMLRKEKLYKKCVPVFHPEVMTWEDYKKMVDTAESKYIAVEGDRGHRRKRIDYIPLLKYAYDRGVKVHGFAMVKRNVMDKYPFYSVDSSSWLAGIQWGGQLVKIKNKIVGMNPKTTNTRSRKTYRIKKTSNLKDERIERLKLSAEAFNYMQKFYTDLWTKRGIIFKK